MTTDQEITAAMATVLGSRHASRNGVARMALERAIYLARKLNRRNARPASEV